MSDMGQVTTRVYRSGRVETIQRITQNVVEIKRDDHGITVALEAGDDLTVALTFDSLLWSILSRWYKLANPQPGNPPPVVRATGTVTLCCECEHLRPGVVLGTDPVCEATRTSYLGHGPGNFQLCRLVNMSGDCSKFTPIVPKPKPKPKPKPWWKFWV